VRVWIEAVAGLVYPAARPPRPWPRLPRPFCERCAEPFPRPLAESFVCANCGERKWALSRLRAAYLERGTVRDAILAFKYRRQFHLRPWLGRWLEDGFQEHYATEKWDALVPVPLHPDRKRKRGFNQSSEIAGWMGKRVGLPVVDALRRVKVTVPQARLSRAERLCNLRGSLALVGGFDPRGKRLVICDDVFTTGATADACARILIREGAKEVVALTVARR